MWQLYQQPFEGAKTYGWRGNFKIEAIVDLLILHYYPPELWQDKGACFLHLLLVLTASIWTVLRHSLDQNTPRFRKEQAFPGACSMSAVSPGFPLQSRFVDISVLKISLVIHAQKSLMTMDKRIMADTSMLMVNESKSCHARSFPSSVVASKASPTANPV